MLWKRGFPLLLDLYLLLGTWKGYVALFEKGQEEPRQIFPCSVDSLPEEDQQRQDLGRPEQGPCADRQRYELCSL